MWAGLSAQQAASTGPGDIISITFAQENVLIMRRRWGHQNGKMENVSFYLVHTKVRTYLLLHSFINFKYLLSFIYVSVSVRSTQQNNIFKCQRCVYIKLYDDGTRGKLQWNVSGSWKDGTHWQHHHTPHHWPAFNVRWIIPSSAITEEKSPLLWVS